MPQAPPPGASMPPSAAAYGDAQPPQKKSKVGLIIGIFLLVFVLCGCGVGVATYFAFQAADSAESVVQEAVDADPLTEGVTETVEEGVRPDAERMVAYFYPEFTLVDFALADTEGDVGSYHLLAQSTDAPDFYITFFADRIVQSEQTDGDDTETSYFDDATLAIWEHPQTVESGLALFVGPDPMFPPNQSLKIMQSFGELHSDLNVSSFGLNSNVQITFRGISDADLEAWYDDFTTFTSVWDNDVAAGTWSESEFTTEPAPE